MKGVVYDFSESRAGEDAPAFLGPWQGKLDCDDYSGYKASFAQCVTDVGCMARARRKFFELHANHKSQIADAFHTWMTLQRQRMSEGSAIAKALDYGLRMGSAGALPSRQSTADRSIRPKLRLVQ
jgi:transposase